ncbi:hypothetical protein DPMN_141782 [Dreissena polymorpha]|uniref:Uncharacterized protein n=1 Tax=Dreissena polymorpha TaxID=45954 RepID=A0A9D4GAN2_DREPO|nr:hypothetical protein DPMN_141782 [Dreissena polymorpha]
MFRMYFWSSAPFRRCGAVFGDIYVQMPVSCVMCSREAPRSRSRRWSKMETARVVYSLCLVDKLMELLVHNLHSLTIAALALPIFIRASTVLVPSLDRVSPKHLKTVFSSNFSPFIVMSV